MNKKCLALVVIILAGFIMGCGGERVRLDPKNPITVTLWHNYGGQMQQTMDELIDEFNMTLGREKGVMISVTSVSALKEQEERLAMIAAGDPGAEAMPDIVTVYPRTALMLCEQGLLAALDEQFAKGELDAYVSQFVEEGRLPDGKLYVFPVAKSTEVLFVNQTLFDRFAAATGITMESLSTFEGIASAAVKYYEWTDQLTPDVEDDGKAFYLADSWFNIAQAGMAQLGAGFVEHDRLLTDAQDYGAIWNFSVLPALLGGYAIHEGYSSDLSKTGDIVCSTGSTAGILFYGDSITYPDNRVEAVEYSILSYPVFNGGEKIAIQRGAGMVVAHSTPEKEYAAALFLKWFTEPEQNLRFVLSTGGYLPVTNQAYEEMMARLTPVAENANVQKLLETAIRMHDEYTFITAPNYESFDALSKAYEARLRTAMREGRQRVLEGEAAQAVLEELGR